MINNGSKGSLLKGMYTTHSLMQTSAPTRDPEGILIFSSDISLKLNGHFGYQKVAVQSHITGAQVWLLYYGSFINAKFDGIPHR